MQCPEEPLNFPPALRPSDSRIDKLKMQVCRDLFEMRAGEITAMIDMEHVRDTANGPCGILLIPNWALITVSATFGPSPFYPSTRRGGLKGAGGSSTDAKIAANIERGF